MGNEWLRYANQGAIRDKPIDDRLVQAMSFLPDMGIEMHVVSGGQDGKGEGSRRTGSTRHDHGGAADADFYMNGRKLDWNNPADQPIFAQIVSRARQNGVTGIGAGDDYMGAGRMHVGFGAESAWGADGKSENAPEWLRTAYAGSPQGIADQTMTALGRPAGGNALARPQQGQQPQQAGYPSQMNALAQQQAPQPPQMVNNALDPRAFMTTVQAPQVLRFT